MANGLLLWLIGFRQAVKAKEPARKHQIEHLANVFSHSIRAAIGPDELERIARDRYVAGEISAEQLSAEIERIETETWRPR